MKMLRRRKVYYTFHSITAVAQCFCYISTHKHTWKNKHTHVLRISFLHAQVCVCRCRCGCQWGRLIINRVIGMFYTYEHLKIYEHVYVNSFLL